MSRIGIRSEVAENLLGHVQPGVVGVYNQYQYVEEKAKALRQLAGLIESILRNDDAERVRARIALASLLKCGRESETNSYSFRPSRGVRYRGSMVCGESNSSRFA